MELTTYILQCMGTVWNYMDKEMIPGITFKQVYIFSWLALILVEFFRVFIFSKITDALDED